MEDVLYFSVKLPPLCIIFRYFSVACMFKSDLSGFAGLEQPSFKKT